MKNLLEIPRTAMEVFEMLPEGTACEVIDNTIYMSPSPTTTHQQILGDIFAAMLYHSKQKTAGRVFVSPCDVYLNDEQDVVQPDILFVEKVREFIIQKKGIIGAPDLVIEILSTNKMHNQQRKLELYQQSRIPEYIIIDPETKDVWTYILQAGKYQEKRCAPGTLFIQKLDFSLEF